MNSQSTVVNFSVAVMYLATTAVIVALNRDALRATYREMRAGWEARRISRITAPGKMWDDVRKAVSDAD